MSDPKQYTVAWICALYEELVAAKLFLEEEHASLEDQPPGDSNSYTLGRVGRHNVVIATLPAGRYGLVSAASIGQNMVRTFPNVRIALMVGIGGGAPSGNCDIRLGDVVVGTPGAGHGGIIQYDYGKMIQNKEFTLTGYSNKPPDVILAAVGRLRAGYEIDGNNISQIVQSTLKDRKKKLQRDYARPSPDTDRLYPADCLHPEGSRDSCAVVCDGYRPIARPDRSEDEDETVIHYGLVASASCLMKDAFTRDKYSKEKDVLCFEMEAAGLVDIFPCITIRGICDYADTHKNDVWHKYAAMAAAAYAKELLCIIQPGAVEGEKKICDVLLELQESNQRIQENTQEIRNGVQNLNNDAQWQRIKKWLLPPDASVNRRNAQKLRHQKSGAWFIQSDAYSAWIQKDRSFLWLHGIPGCGKTVLTTAIIDDLSTKVDPQNIVYFYFDFADTGKQDFDDMLRSLIWQLSGQHENAQTVLRSLYSSCDQGERQPDLESSFGSIVKAVEELWIVIDALDECTRSQGQLLTWIKNLIEGETNIHLLVASRPEHDIDHAIRGWALKQDLLSIQEGIDKHDIENYVVSRLEQGKLGERWKKRPEMKSKIKDALVTKADGMFRLVSCQLDELEMCLRPADVESALVTLPKTLDAMYGLMIKNLDTKPESPALRILLFLTYAKCPLRLEEVAEAITVDISNREFDESRRMPLPREILAYCPSLITIAQVEGDMFSRETRSEVRLAHFSVREYLTSDRLDRSLAEHFEKTHANASIANFCLVYMLKLNYDISDCAFYKRWDEAKEKYPLLYYAVHNWVTHANATGNSAHFDKSLAVELLDCKSKAYKWVASVHYRSYEAIPALYYAADVGFSPVIEILLNHGADVNAQGGMYGNALQAASTRGHSQIVEILLNHGADVNAQGGGVYANALQAASERGHSQTVEILLNHGADVNAQRGAFSNALQAASAEGHSEIVEILLNHGADVNAKGGIFGNALQAATELGCEAIVRLLLEKNIDILIYGNALQAASERGHEAIVRLMLEKNIDTIIYGNALQAASMGHESIVRLLLENNFGAIFYGRALHIAASRGHEAIVRLLLEKNIDIDTTFYGNALQTATDWGYEAIVRLLLEKNIDIDTTFYGNALQTASEKGYEAIVRLLLEKNIDIDTTSYGEALQAASKGHEAIVRGFIDIKIIPYRNGSLRASEKSYKAIVRLLHQKIADITLQGADFQPETKHIAPLPKEAAAKRSRSPRPIKRRRLNSEGEEEREEEREEDSDML